MTIENAKRMAFKYPNICCPLVVDVVLESWGEDVPEMFYRKAKREVGLPLGDLLKDLDMEVKRELELRVIDGRKSRVFKLLSKLIFSAEIESGYLALFFEPKDPGETNHIKLVGKGEAESIRIWDVFAEDGNGFDYVDVFSDMDLWH